MSILKPIVKAVVMAALALALWLPSTPAEGDGWDWQFAPYLFASSMTVDVEANGTPIIEGEASFSDLVDKLDFAFAFHFEGAKGKGGFLFDFYFASLGDSNSLQVPELPILDDLIQTKSDIEMTLLEAGGFWRPGGGPQGFDVLFGVRMIDLDQEFTISVGPPIDVSTEFGSAKTFTDGFVGVRYTGGNKWRFNARGDIAAGSTEGAWNVIVGGSYNWGRDNRFGILLGWREFHFEVEDDDRNIKFETELGLSGPYTAFRIGF